MINKDQRRILILIFGFLIFCAGCGNFLANVPAVELANKGEIKGYVYDSNASNAYAGKFVPLAGAKVYVSSFEAMTNADGSYTLSGLPPGAVIITASAEGCAAQTLSVNRGTIIFYLSKSNYSYQESYGSATITGAIYGLPAGVQGVYGNANSASKSGYNFNYDSSLFRYTINRAPDDGDTYIFAYYSSGETGDYRQIYTYAKTSMSPATKEVNLDFATSTNQLSVNVDLPIGFKSPYLNIVVYDGYRSLKTLYSKAQTQEASFHAANLPKLQADNTLGFSMMVSSIATLEATAKVVWRYNLKAGESVSVDYKDVPDLALSAPIDGISIGKNPAFSWEAINDDRIIYAVALMLESPASYAKTVWSVFTKENSIILPVNIFLADGVYRWQVTAAYYPNLDLADLGATIVNASPQWGILSAVRRFTYAK